MALPPNGKPLVVSCHHCARVHVVPEAVPRSNALCTRCDAHLLPWWITYRNNTWAMLFTLATLAHYPFAIFLPILRTDELGLVRDINILDGIRSMFLAGRPGVASAILICSVVIPLVKIIGLYFLAARNRGYTSRIHGKLLSIIKLIGRFGMLDVYLVAVLLEIKTDMVQLSPGPGLVAFTLCVFLSLLSTLTFDAESIWEET